jgi:hypothetical protein
LEQVDARIVSKDGGAYVPPFGKLALAWLLFALLALATCGSDRSATVGDETPSATSTIQYRMAEIKTATPVPAGVSPTPTPVDASPTAPKPRATFVPLITPSPTPTGENTTKAGVPRITVQAAQLKTEAGEAILVDVRTRATYDVKHIAGAISMPLDEVARRSAELPTDKLVIFYCA